MFYGIPGIISLALALVFTATRQVITSAASITIGVTVVGLILLTVVIVLWVLVTLLREYNKNYNY